MSPENEVSLEEAAERRGAGLAMRADLLRMVAELDAEITRVDATTAALRGAEAMETSQ